MAVAGGIVIVIEDDESMRDALESLLGAAGMRTSAYCSAEEFLASRIPQDARCIVSDVRLPAMSGLDLLCELRRRRFRTPVIISTAHDSQALNDEALRRGAAAYLPKPFAGTALLDAIARV